MALKLYHGHGSPYSWRVWLALEAKKVPYEVRLLSFQNKETRKPEFVAINPRHVVPTIVEDDGFALWESIAILEYLDERHAGGAKLYPGDARARARIRRLIREAEQHLDREGIDPITDEFFGKDGAPADMQKVESCRDKIVEELAVLEKEVRGDYFEGAELSALDLVVYPMIGYLKRITFRKPEARLTEIIPPKIAACAKRIEALPYFDKTFPAHWR
jgi:glutathione S-transferase